MSAIEISGRIEELHVGKLMRLIRMSRRTGTLRLSDHGQQGTIEFYNGNIVRAHASWKYDDLGTLLLDRGAISRQQLDRAIEEQVCRPDSPPIGRVLIDLGITNADEVRDAMRAQVDSVVAHLLRIGHGNFEFQARVDIADDITQDVAEVLRELSVTIESSMARGSSDPRAVQQDLRLRQLRSHGEAFRSARSEAGLLRTLLDAMRRHTARQWLFAPRRDAYVAIESRGHDLPDVGSLKIPRHAFPAPVSASVRSTVAEEAEMAELHEAIGAPESGEFLLAGLRTFGTRRPAAARYLLYADQGSTQRPLPSTDYVDLLVLQATLVGERLHARRTAAKKRPLRKASKGSRAQGK